MIRTARLRAFAKLNLGLRVIAKRPDGYHELRTVFQTISLADRIQVTCAKARTTRIRIEGTPDIPDNLIEKAASLALEAMKIHGDIRFNLKKNIPTGAGLGGGSSDAAATLLALPCLFRKPLPMEVLSGLAAQLGSDVPFFLHGGTALGLGRGEELYPLPARSGSYVLLVTPGIHSSTALAYRDLSQKLTSIELQNKLDSFQAGVWEADEGCLHNDFEAVVFARHPELRELRDRLRRFGAHAAMTGSGSAVFGVFKGSAEMRRAEKALSDQKVFAVKFLSRARYRAAWRTALGVSVPNSQHSNRKVDDLWPPRNLHER